MFIHSEVIKEQRVLKGWTQQHLADVAGLSLRTIQRVENQGQASMETINSLCAVLEIDRDLLNQQKQEEKRALQKTLFFIVLSGLLGFVLGISMMFLLRS